MLEFRKPSPNPQLILKQMQECLTILCLIEDSTYIHAMDALDLAVALLDQACHAPPQKLLIL